MSDEELLALPRSLVQAALPELASDVCIAALDAAIACAAEGSSLVETAAKLRSISDDAAFAVKLMSDYIDE